MGGARIVALAVVLSLAAGCPGRRGGGGGDDDDTGGDPDGGGGGDDRAALQDYLDGLAGPYCEWLIGCGEVPADQQAQCEQDVGSEVGGTQLCDELVDYWVAHRDDLEACAADPTAPCGTDDFSQFCPAASDLDIDGICAAAPECVLPSDCGDGETCENDVCVPVTSDCVETTFVVTNGYELAGDLYTGTSWELDDCTEIQPDSWTITIRCPVGAFGQTDLISSGCALLGVAAPGNILSDNGAAPPAGYDECAGQTVTNATITCYQQCGDLYEFEITSGPC